MKLLIDIFCFRWRSAEEMDDHSMMTIYQFPSNAENTSDSCSMKHESYLMRSSEHGGVRAKRSMVREQSSVVCAQWLLYPGFLNAAFLLWISPCEVPLRTTCLTRFSASNAGVL